MSFNRLSTGRRQGSTQQAAFACELAGAMVAITNAPLSRTMSGAIVKQSATNPSGLADVPLNHEGAPPSRRSKRTMSQIRRVCPPDAALKRMIRKVLLTDPGMRFGAAVTMATRTRCTEQLEEETGVSLKHKAGFIHKELERICLGGDSKPKRAAKRAAPEEAEQEQEEEDLGFLLSASTGAFMAELKTTLESSSKKPRCESPQQQAAAAAPPADSDSEEEEGQEVEQEVEQQEEQEEEAPITLARTTSGLERQLAVALRQADTILSYRTPEEEEDQQGEQEQEQEEEQEEEVPAVTASGTGSGMDEEMLRRAKMTRKFTQLRETLTDTDTDPDHAAPTALEAADDEVDMQEEIPMNSDHLPLPELITPSPRASLDASLNASYVTANGEDISAMMEDFEDLADAQEAEEVTTTVTQLVNTDNTAQP